MKLFLLSLYIFLSFQFISAQDYRENKLIVYGNAVIKAQTDIATFTFSFIGVGPSLELAINDARNKINLVSKELKNIGLTEKSLSTSYFYSGENQNDKAFLSSSRDYKAEIKVVVTLDVFELLEKAITTVSKFSPDYISDISFALKNHSEISKEVLQKAAANAKENAEILATQLGITNMKPLYVEDLSFPNGNDISRNFFRGSRNAEVVLDEKGVQTINIGNTFFSPEIKLIAKVKVIYEIQ
ncbi:MAG: SIMPL domain-containing protein [Ignavibacteriales bacterium]|nr:SIMPL domain-containing protein [Ignavibacteriales bacterium]